MDTSKDEYFYYGCFEPKNIYMDVLHIHLRRSRKKIWMFSAKPKKIWTQNHIFWTVLDLEITILGIKNRIFRACGAKILLFWSDLPFRNHDFVDEKHIFPSIFFSGSNIFSRSNDFSTHYFFEIQYCFETQI